MSKIFDVIVSGVSLVLDGNIPAVQHAKSKYAIFKSKKSVEIEKLEHIEKKFRSMSLGGKEETICGPSGVDEG